MTEVATVKQHLERRFHDQGIVFWHDPEGQYASHLDSLDLSDVTTQAPGEVKSTDGADLHVAALRGALVQTLNDGKRIIL